LRSFALDNVKTNWGFAVPLDLNIADLSLFVAQMENITTDDITKYAIWAGIAILLFMMAGLGMALLFDRDGISKSPPRHDR